MTDERKEKEGEWKGMTKRGREGGRRRRAVRRKWRVIGIQNGRREGKRRIIPVETRETVEKKKARE